MEGFLGMIKLFAGQTPPEGWMNCDGALLLTEDYPELYEMVGTRYGGDDNSTFALPKMDNPGMGQYLVRVKPSANPEAKGMLSQVALYLGTDSPEGWMQCNGRMLNVADYPVLFQLMGTKHGGDGQQTFGIPNAPVQQGIVYLICVDGLDPREGQGEEEDDDDY